MTLRPTTQDGSVLEWRKSSHSTDDGPACVEVAAAPGVVRVRDSTDPQGPWLAFAPEEWSAFVRFAAAG
ncbi:DUF397 domain-containing protein [Streptomyces sp. NPDC018031]|uniref:DUF397 domain-containing protein n=1 Tax=Streptomyces sp. NPDC018031 TaxID=3365033 RepID=UPI0037B1F762